MPRKFKGRPFWRANPIVIDLDKVRFIDTKVAICGLRSDLTNGWNIN